MHRRRREPASQLSSSLFRLPAELRLAIFECLDFPPVNHAQAYGLILSCRQAKIECEQVAVKSFKSWIAAVRRDDVTKCEFDVRIFLPPAAPVGLSYDFRTFKELVIVLPSTCCELSMSLTSFYINLRHLNLIFGLWLDRLTIHFQGFLGENLSKSRLASMYHRMVSIVQGGLSHAHNPDLHAKRKKQVRDYSRLWAHWKPVPTFAKELVVSWDMTQDGLSYAERVQLVGTTHRFENPEAMFRSMHEVLNRDGLLGEIMLASAARFRPTAREGLEMRRHDPWSHSDCAVDRHRRVIKGLPANADNGWVR